MPIAPILRLAVVHVCLSTDRSSPLSIEGDVDLPTGLITWPIEQCPDCQEPLERLYVRKEVLKQYYEIEHALPTASPEVNLFTTERPRRKDAFLKKFFNEDV